MAFAIGGDAVDGLERGVGNPDGVIGDGEPVGLAAELDRGSGLKGGERVLQGFQIGFLSRKVLRGCGADQEEKGEGAN
jgi:hypothetical protein